MCAPEKPISRLTCRYCGHATANVTEVCGPCVAVLADRRFLAADLRCPACRGSGTLFLGAGGYPTCSRLDCPNPTLVSDLLTQESGAWQAIREWYAGAMAE